MRKTRTFRSATCFDVESGIKAVAEPAADNRVETRDGRKSPGLVKSVRLYHCGFCTNNLKILFKHRSWEKRRFPATAVLIEHRTYGNILYDTGYSERNMRGGIFLRIYRFLNPVSMTRGQTVREKLEKDGIEPESIRAIILSHAHPDHVGGLSQFSGYELIATDEVVDVLRRGRMSDLVFRELLPERGTIGKWIRLQTCSRDHFLCDYFDRVYDIFEDGSVVGVVLEGHSLGQLGIWIPDHRVFLAADACWGDDLVSAVPSMRLVAKMIQRDFPAYQETVAKLCRMKRDHPEIQVVFTHQKGRERCYAG